MIPKKIHYCWFGGNPKSEIIQKCIASWEKHCPDWEIIEWNEENYNINKSEFVSEAYQAKKWAFVSDYARLDILYSHGGVYLDTDVELFAEPLEWLENEATFFFETGRVVATGLGFSAEKGNDALKCMLNQYNGLHFIVNGEIQLFPCPEKNTKGLCEFSPLFKRNGETQIIDGVKIASLYEYQKVAKHHYTGSWGDDKTVKKAFKSTWLKRLLRKPKNFEIIEKFFGKKGLKLYTFLCYDLQEYGILHFLKRMKNRMKRKM